MSENLSLLLVEDHPDIASLICDYFEGRNHIVDYAADGVTGLHLAVSNEFDAIILDLMLPDTDGFELLKIIRQQQSNVLVLILSARGQEMDKVNGLKLGADDYLTKPFGLMELLARIEALLRRRSHTKPVKLIEEKIAFGDIEADPLSRSVYRNSNPVELAPKEFDLLMALIDCAGQVQTRLQLLQSVWGHQAKVETRTIDTHIGELRKKLEADPANPQFILTARKKGYWFRWG